MKLVPSYPPPPFLLVVCHLRYMAWRPVQARVGGTSRRKCIECPLTNAAGIPLAASVFLIVGTVAVDGPAGREVTVCAVLPDTAAATLVQVSCCMVCCRAYECAPSQPSDLDRWTAGRGAARGAARGVPTKSRG